MACASGSRERANNRGLRGQPCLDPLETAKGRELVLPVSTLAVGFLYSTLIMLMLHLKVKVARSWSTPLGPLLC